MNSVQLTQANKERLERLGLIETTTLAQEAKGFKRFSDPITNAFYLFSPKGYVYRQTAAGSYQINPRFKVPGNYNASKMIQTTIKPSNSGALTEIAVRGVKNFRG